jgi:Uma2 family endonuclease
MSPTQPAAVPKTRMTVDEYWEFVNRPENSDRFFELRRGEVIEMPRPRKPHGIVCSRIAALLDRYAEARGAGYVECNDTGVILQEAPGTVVGPDVAFFTDVATFDDVAPKWSDTPPVLAVEVLSPTDKPIRVNEKVQDYLTGGVRVVWVVDYEERKVAVYRHDRTHVVLTEDAVISGDPDLPEFACPVAALFRLPGQKPPEGPPPPA